MDLFRNQLIIFLSLLYLVSATPCQQTGLSKFSQEVKRMLPQETYKRVFSVQRDVPDQFVQAVRNGADKLVQLFNTPLPDSTVKKLIEGGEDYNNKAATAPYFRVLVNSVGDTLRDQGVLKDDNLEDLAKSLVKNLIDASKLLKSENVQETYPAIITANVKLLKSLGLKCPEVQRNLANNINIEVNRLTLDTRKKE